MSTYVFLFCISPFLMMIAKKMNKQNVFRSICILFALLIPCIIAGCRNLTVGTDVSVYVNYQFNKALKAEKMFLFLNENGDKLYALLTYFIAKTFGNIHVLLFVIQLINIIPIYILIKDENVSLPMAFFIYLSFIYLKSFNLVRQFLAISFTILAFVSLKNNKYFLTVCWMIIAYFFHSSSIIMLLVFYLYKISGKDSKDTISFFTVLMYCLIISFVFFPVFIRFVRTIPMFSNITTLMNSSYENNFIRIDKIDTFFRIFWILLIGYLNKKYLLSKKIDNYSFYYRLMIIDLIFYSYNIFISYAERISFYFGPIAYILLIPQLIKVLKKDNKNYFIFNCFIFVVFFAYFYLKYIYQNAGGVNPYTSVILGI